MSPLRASSLREFNTGCSALHRALTRAPRTWAFVCFPVFACRSNVSISIEVGFPRSDYRHLPISSTISAFSPSFPYGGHAHEPIQLFSRQKRLGRSEKAVELVAVLLKFFRALLPQY